MFAGGVAERALFVACMWFLLSSCTLHILCNSELMRAIRIQHVQNALTDVESHNCHICSMRLQLINNISSVILL